MIEQTAFEITTWNYKGFSRPIEETEAIPSEVALEVQKKRNSQKKGIAVRFTAQFTFENEVILEFSGEHSYVIDFEDVIDEHELIKMLRNSYQMFKEKFDFKKLTTILLSRSLKPLNESEINLEGIIPMLM